MLRGEFGGKKWRLFWNYPDGKTGEVTECLLEVGETTYWGVARRHPGDQPNPETARRLSLTRAMYGDELSPEPPIFPTREENKEFRRQVWGVYLGRGKNTEIWDYLNAPESRSLIDSRMVGGENA